MVPKLGVMGKKRSLCKTQSNFNRRDKILPNNVQLGPDSAAADTFITMDKETLRPVKLYFLPPVLVVTKFTSDRQCEQPKDELVLEVQQCLLDCRDGSGESQSFLCDLLIPWVCCCPLSVTQLDQILKRERNTQLLPNPPQIRTLIFLKTGP